MSWNRLQYDVKAYEHSLRESQGPGLYTYAKPLVKDHRSPNFDVNGCPETQCYPFAPGMLGSGVSVDSDRYFVDVESELRSIGVPLSKDPQFISNHRNPKCNGVTSNEGLPCGGGVTASVSCNDCTRGSRAGDRGLMHFKDCTIPSEDTRLSNPPSNLHGTGWNRFDYLHQNPQDNAIFKFHVPINNRLVVKDNHRPCVPRPINQENCGPVPQQKQKCSEIKNQCGVPTGALHNYYNQQRNQCFCRN
jgi:hypothetical protein